MPTLEGWTWERQRYGFKPDKSTPAEEHWAFSQMPPSKRSYRYSFEMSSRTCVGLSAGQSATVYKMPEGKKGTLNSKVKYELALTWFIGSASSFWLIKPESKTHLWLYNIADISSLIQAISQHRYLQLKCQPVSIFLHFPPTTSSCSAFSLMPMLLI